MDQLVSSLNLSENRIQYLSENGIYCVHDYEENTVNRKIENWDKITKCPSTYSAFELYQNERLNWKTFKILIPQLEQIFASEIRPGLVTELVGLPGSGKTQICFHLALSNLSETFYISTNHNFSSQRLREIAEKNNLNVEETLSRIHCLTVSKDWELMGCIYFLQQWLTEHNNVRLLIIDNFPWPFKQVDSNSEKVEKQQVIQCFLKKIRVLADLHQFAVIITNNMTIRVNNEETSLVSALGDGLFHGINNKIILSKENELFSAEVVKTVTGNLQIHEKVSYFLQQ